MHTVRPLLLLLAVLGWATVASAQQGGGNGGGNGGGGGGNPGNNGPGGILIDPDGIVTDSKKARLSARLDKRRLAAEAKRLPTEVNQQTPLRFVSLPGLEAICRECIAEQRPLPPEVEFVGGLQRIDYVFVLPETRDLVIGGPADGFSPNEIGVMVGVNSGRPVLRLDDLLVALRGKSRVMGCSIDPVPRRLAEMKRYLEQVGVADSVAEARKRYGKMAKILGNQTVTVFGVDPSSHFARVLVEADYRMKRISVGLDKSRIRGLKSYLQMQGAGHNSMRRWWFAPNYEAISHNEDKTAWQLTGARVRMLAQEELVDERGHRTAAGYKRRSTEQFARQFTDKYDEIAKRSPVFASLQNLFDLAVTAALIRRENMAGRIGWAMSTFQNPKVLPGRKFNVPREVRTVSNSKVVNKTLVMGVVGGGVKIDAFGVLGGIRPDVSPSLDGIVKDSQRDGNAPQQWYWDRPPVGR